MIRHHFRVFFQDGYIMIPDPLPPRTLKTNSGQDILKHPIFIVRCFFLIGSSLDTIKVRGRPGGTSTKHRMFLQVLRILSCGGCVGKTAATKQLTRRSKHRM
ncbi:hypothetical protein TGAM01_v203062 [Trichoderma gamsii]|uniref:Uncharacterized protein n=1 Tax=Trichoderma gamsii TaxID=398673 RepID=A0A2P4ZUG3_9HYPO|nr:hypothetical protein TGAM01_v203062 [Trichoderma gamsii]PON27925.1 hypothetical protein TGAM01_v203062 [Trichoderma gamsii]